MKKTLFFLGGIATVPFAATLIFHLSQNHTFMFWVAVIWSKITGQVI